jgi:hypothetical protein
MLFNRKMPRRRLWKLLLGLQSPSLSAVMIATDQRRAPA